VDWNAEEIGAEAEVEGRCGWGRGEWECGGGVQDPGAACVLMSVRQRCKQTEVLGGVIGERRSQKRLRHWQCQGSVAEIMGSDLLNIFQIYQFPCYVIQDSGACQ
jgi:hypothetical protein